MLRRASLPKSPLRLRVAQRPKRQFPRTLLRLTSHRPSKTSQGSITKTSNVVSFLFDLSKLLPKNLSLHDEEDNLVLSLENSVVKVSKKSKQTASTPITDIEQWTTAFTSYMSVLIDKLPTRSQELLQYVSLIRYAARGHKGLGWAIYDFKVTEHSFLVYKC